MSNSEHFEHVCESAALYSTGTLPVEESRQFNLRLRSGCPLCMAEVSDCQRALEETVLATVQPVAPSAQLENKLFNRLGLLGELKPSASPAEPAESEASQPPVRLSEMIIVPTGEDDWVTAPYPGVKLRYLRRDKTFLVRMEPGSSLPAHSHDYDETCLMIDGTVTDESGSIARAGDYVFMPKGSKHAKLFSETGATFLIAYSTPLT